jgi:hypothetical protein
MESRRSSAISLERIAVFCRPPVASMANASQYGEAFTRNARDVIESAFENLARFEDIATDEHLLAKLKCEMSSTQIEEAARVVQRDLLQLESNAAGSMQAPDDGVRAAGPGPAWINTLV